MSVLADYIQTSPRFARSANVERDHGSSAISGYIPTGRAIDVVSRIARGFISPAAGRTFSITGPHGGGKSSLAVFLDGLLSPFGNPEHETSHKALRAADESADSLLNDGLNALGAIDTGFVRAFATARTEPIAKTIARALHSGAVRTFGFNQDVVPEHFAEGTASDPTLDEIRSTVSHLCKVRPVLIVIDEFGKNLEAYANSDGSGDPYLLQELAEATQGASSLPLTIITMQHLAFEEYVQDTTIARRREWAKVQGRFQDIPYVETPAQSRQLIAACFSYRVQEIEDEANKWIASKSAQIDRLGLRDLSVYAPSAMPLHPLVLAVLPDLCTRYGQNERTLFSFLAGSEPKAVPAYLAKQSWRPGSRLPVLGVDGVYDYFLDSATNAVGISENASRWMEIETRIRDTAGLKPNQLKAVKTIGLLNLIANGGAIRASQSMLSFALIDGKAGSRSEADVRRTLEGLEKLGLIVYREFSDEWRIWQGSDYNIRLTIEQARREVVEQSLASLLNQVVPLEPAVAGRHSQRTGILRIFNQRFADFNLNESEALAPEWDGSVEYSVESELELPATQSDPRPRVVVVPESIEDIRLAAIESAALTMALRQAQTDNADWVAQRELSERTAAATQVLRKAVERTWSTTASWLYVGYPNEALIPRAGLSAMLSQVSDRAYSASPRVANEMIARRELTSQGAKARRVLMEAMLQNTASECFGLAGYGPDRAIYEAIFRLTGLHRRGKDSQWHISQPKSGPWRAVWAEIDGAFTDPSHDRRPVIGVFDRVKAPPFGLKDGVIPLLVVASLLKNGDDVALYEHGSLVLELDDAIAERLTKNPVHFSYKNTNTSSGIRRSILDTLSARLKIGQNGRQPTFLNVATALYRELRMLPPYSQKTKRNLSPQAIDVRSAFQTASEPDVLIFEDLPRIFGLTLDRDADSRKNKRSIVDFANRVADTVLELRSVYPNLLLEIAAAVAEATATSGDLADVQQRLAGQAANLDGRVLEPKLRSFVGALGRPLEPDHWLENVAMVVSEGQAPRTWTDEAAFRFPLLIAEVGGTMRRTQALLYDRIAAAGDTTSFATSRLTVTRPDGTETAEILSVSDREVAAIDAVLDPLLDELEKLWGSRATACRMLVARLVVGTDEDIESKAVRSDRKDVNHG